MHYYKDFIKQKDGIIKAIKKKGFSPENVSGYSGDTGIPLTVIYEFIMQELVEYRDICIREITRLDEFYGDKGRVL